MFSSGLAVFLLCGSFTIVAFVAALMAEGVRSRASMRAWIALGYVGAFIDLGSSMVWSSLSGLSFQDYEANPVAGSVGPMGMAVFMLVLAAFAYSTAPMMDTHPLLRRYSRILWTTFAFRSALFCLSNAYFGLWSLYIM